MKGGAAAARATDRLGATAIWALAAVLALGAAHDAAWARDVARIDQTQADGSAAHIVQSGQASEVSIQQIGESHYAEVLDAGRGAVLSLEQSGLEQRAVVALSGGDAVGAIAQAGAGNHLDIDAHGYGNSFSMVQSAPLMDPLYGNVAGLRQRGSGNNAWQSQYGAGNVMLLEQTGDANTADLLQEGEGHSMMVVQTNDGNAATLSQYGADAAIDIRQTGGMAVNITQNTVR